MAHEIAVTLVAWNILLLWFNIQCSFWLQKLFSVKLVTSISSCLEFFYCNPVVWNFLFQQFLSTFRLMILCWSYIYIDSMRFLIWLCNVICWNKVAAQGYLLQVLSTSSLAEFFRSICHGFEGGRSTCVFVKYHLVIDFMGSLVSIVQVCGLDFFVASIAKWIETWWYCRWWMLIYLLLARKRWHLICNHLSQRKICFLFINSIEKSCRNMSPFFQTLNKFTHEWMVKNLMISSC